VPAGCSRSFSPGTPSITVSHSLYGSRTSCESSCFSTFSISARSRVKPTSSASSITISSSAEDACEQMTGPR
jgi:hypothetical protein